MAAARRRTRRGPRDDRARSSTRWSACISRRARPAREDLAFHLADLRRHATIRCSGSCSRRCARPSSGSGSSLSTGRISPRRSFPFHRELFDAIARGDAERRARQHAGDPRHRRGGHQGNVAMTDRSRLRSTVEAVADRRPRRGATPSTPSCRRSSRPRSSPSPSYDEMVATYRGETVRPIYSARPQPDGAACSRRSWPSSKAPRTRSASPAAWRRSRRPCSAFVAPGDRIVAVRTRLSRRLPPVRDVAAAHGRRGRLCRRPRPRRPSRAALPGAQLLYLESPTSWVIEAQDVARARRARHGATASLTIIDNSWATPIFQQPLALGVDLVLHSASKYHRRPQRRGRRRRRRLDAS